MSFKIIKEYVLGDMVASYRTDHQGKKITLLLLPADGDLEEKEKNEQLDSLVQYKLTGDIYDEAYAIGNSMRNSQSVRELELKEHKEKKRGDITVIETLLEDARGYEVIHRLSWKAGARYVRICCEFWNKSEESVNMEMFESFSLSGLSPYLKGDGHNGLNLHRIRSVWSQEGRHEVLPIEDLQLEPAWDPHAVRCERFGQVGSMPVNKFFPFIAIEDHVNSVFWGAQIAHPASWQIEAYRKDDALCISGGLADRDFGHWLKMIAPGESFTTPEAIVSVAKTESFDEFTNRLIDASMENISERPKSEEDLPIIFNEYCTTWGNPSHENICEILDCIKGKGFQYFVIDCGWYKEPGIPWDVDMGDYNVSEELFPQGLDKTVDKIRDAGMIPGIWFEIDNVGSEAKSYQMKEHLLHKDEQILTTYFRRFWDMRSPWVEEYLTEKVIGTLQKYGFGYMKIDYNETIGIGCDGAESLGEGLRQNMEASVAFIEKVKEKVPGIVLENCASGGHRLEPSLMAQMSMASFSDAHECLEIPIIASDLHRVIHPAQSQIWAVIREKDSLQRIAYSLISTFLGRMCISGDVTRLSEKQWAVIEEGMSFYKKLVPIIKKGQSYHYGTRMKSVRNPEGWQVLLRKGETGGAFVIIHTFAGELPEKIEIDLPKDIGCKEYEVYSDTQEDIVLEHGKLMYKPKKCWKAVAVYLH